LSELQYQSRPISQGVISGSEFTNLLPYVGLEMRIGLITVIVLCNTVRCNAASMWTSCSITAIQVENCLPFEYAADFKATLQAGLYD